MVGGADHVPTLAAPRFFEANGLKWLVAVQGLAFQIRP
jgi:hypothetical protein